MSLDNEFQRGIAEGMKRERQRWLANARLCLEMSGDTSIEPSKFGSPEMQALIVARALQKQGAPTVVPNYEQFAIGILRHAREHAGCDVDGGTIQDMATLHGLLVKVEAKERCGDSCVCAEFADFPQSCYRYNPAITGAAPRESGRAARTPQDVAKAAHVDWREKQINGSTS
jgi:hypothetical protein